MYINKWWGNYIGASDDSLLLLDYFGSKQGEVFLLKDIIKDLHMDSVIEDEIYKDGDLFFNLENEYAPHFDMSVSVLVDLSALLLESLKNKNISIGELDDSSKYDKNFTIQADQEDIKKLKNSLDYFINNSTLFEIVDFIPSEEYTHFIDDCKEISSNLNEYIS